MSESFPYHSFSISDIERYHSGQMTPAERHALEKAALDDPFLADALEGYSYTASPVEDVKALRERMEGKQARRKIYPLGLWNYQWWQVAALFVLLAGAGWLVYHTGLFSKKEIALTQTPKNEVPPAPEVHTPADSSQTKQTEMVKTEQVVAQPSANKINRTGARLLTKHKEEPASFIPDTTKPVYDAVASAPALADNEQQKPESTQSFYRSRNANKTSVFYSNASPLEKNKNQPSNSRIALPAPDSNAGLAGRAQGVQTTPDTLHLNVVMKESKESLNEVVVVNMHARKKQEAKPNVKYGELEPARGWTDFDDYIAQNLKAPEEVKGKTVSGDVELSFDVNNVGEPVNIKVEKSLCSTCDKEAIRLLREGPKWKKNKSQKGRITIHF